VQAADPFVVLGNFMTRRWKRKLVDTVLAFVDPTKSNSSRAIIVVG